MQTATDEALAISALARSVWHDFRRARRPLILLEVLFKLFQTWLLLPVVAVVLGAVLSRAGHIAVSNLDIFGFLLTPAGLFYAALFFTVAVALWLLEQAGIMVVVALTGSVNRPPLRQVLGTVTRQTLRVFQLGAVKAVLLAVTFVPFVLLAVLTYTLLLSQHDIYFYLKDRPPAFWVAAGIGGLILLAAVAVGMWLYVRWAFSLPILLFEEQSARGALRASRERVRGVGWRVGLILLGWQFGALLLGLALQAGFRLVAAAALEHAGERPVALILLLLLVQGMLLASLAFVAVVGQALLTRRLYLARNAQLGLVGPDSLEPAAGTEKPVWAGPRFLFYLSLPLFLLAPLALWLALTRYVADRPPVRVTAHRGHARLAPENTLSAIRKAIESGADYVEIDVQQTADGVIVLLHDRDLKRVAGDSRRITDVPYAEVRKLDVGSWFDPSFAGERIPTLVEVIDLCRGRIRVNIELKLFGPDRRLVPAVARLLREHDFESECVVKTFNYEALQELKRENPRVRTGLLVAHALGDVSRLEVDGLSVWADRLSDELLREAQRRGMEVHVWTVNDPRQMIRLMKRGVDNVITSDPDQMIRVRDEWANLSGSERLVLASRLLLGLAP